MKKLSLITFSILFIVFIQACKKSSSDSTTTTTTPTFQVYVNGTLWTPSSVTATLTYNTTAKTKTLNLTGIDTTDKITWNIIQPATALDSTYTAQTYNATDTVNIVPKYYTINSSNVFVSTGTLKAGSFIITSFDEKKKVMTGTFSFSTTRLNFDTNGNLLSITSNSITAGQFNDFPFTFIKK